MRFFCLALLLPLVGSAAHPARDHRSLSAGRPYPSPRSPTARLGRVRSEELGIRRLRERQDQIHRHRLAAPGHHRRARRLRLAAAGRGNPVRSCQTGGRDRRVAGPGPWQLPALLRRVQACEGGGGRGSRGAGPGGRHRAAASRRIPARGRAGSQQRAVHHGTGEPAQFDPVIPPSSAAFHLRCGRATGSFPQPERRHDGRDFQLSDPSDCHAEGRRNSRN